MKRMTAVLLAAVLLAVSAGCAADKHSVDNDAVSAAAELGSSYVELDCVAGHYEMNLRLDTDTDTLSGTSVAEITNTGSEDIDELYFYLQSMMMCDNADITAAKNAVTGQTLEVDSKDKSNCSAKIELEDPLTSGSTMSVELSFTETFAENGMRASLFTSKDGKLYSMMMCFPMLAACVDGEWITHDYFDLGEITCEAPTDYDVTFTCPPEYTVLASGHQTTKDGVTVIEAKQVREMAIVASDDMSVETAEADGIRVNLCRPRYGLIDETLLSTVYDMVRENAVASLKMYQEKVGPYAYDEIDVVPLPKTDSMIGGMEMPGLYTYVVLKKSDDRLTDKEYLEETAGETITTVAHETAHQWFYGGVCDDQFREPWLDESFATYLHQYYLLHFMDSGTDGFTVTNRYYSTPADETDEYNFDEEDPDYVNFSVNQYGDGEASDLQAVYNPRFLGSLEQAMGSEQFFKMLSDWYQSNTGKIVRGRSFVNHVMRYSQEDSVKEVLNLYLSDEDL